MVFLVIITLMCFVGVPSCALLGFVWCSWLCFPRALLLLLVVFSRALLMFVVIALLVLLVFVVVVLLGFWCLWLLLS